MKKMLKGFTLAEVLITLSIIGVIAAITLPSLQVNVQKQGVSAQLGKFYSQFEEGIKRYMVEENLESISGSFNADAFASRHLNIVQACTRANAADCFAETYSSVEGVTKINIRESVTSGKNIYMLKDGAVLQFSSSGLGLLFDVNGKKGPNKMGIDLHAIGIMPDGSLDASYAYDNRISNPTRAKQALTTNLNACKKGSYEGCFAHLIRNNFKFDY